MCTFFGLNNVIVNNCFIFYAHTAKAEGRKVSKVDFMQDLAYSLCKPFALERLENHGRYLSDELKDKIKTTFGQTPLGAVAADPAEPFTGWKKGPSRKRCPYDDGSNSHFSGLNRCHGKDCKNTSICSHHSVLLYKACYEKIKNHL